MADCAQLIVNNVANALGGEVVETRFADLLQPQQKTDDAKEIKDRIFTGLRKLGGMPDERI